MKNNDNLEKRKRKRKRKFYLDGSAVGGGEERERDGEEAFNHKHIFFSQRLSPLPWIKAHQLLHCQIECYLHTHILHKTPTNHLCIINQTDHYY